MVYPEDSVPSPNVSRDHLDDADSTPLDQQSFIIASQPRRGSSDHVRPSFPTPGQIRSMFNTGKIGCFPEYAASPSSMSDPIHWRPNDHYDLLEEKLLKIHHWADMTASFQQQPYNEVEINGFSDVNRSFISSLDDDSVYNSNTRISIEQCGSSDTPISVYSELECEQRQNFEDLVANDEDLESNEINNFSTDNFYEYNVEKPARNSRRPVNELIQQRYPNYYAQMNKTFDRRPMNNMASNASHTSMQRTIMTNVTKDQSSHMLEGENSYVSKKLNMSGHSSEDKNSYLNNLTDIVRSLESIYENDKNAYHVIEKLLEIFKLNGNDVNGKLEGDTKTLLKEKFHRYIERTCQKSDAYDDVDKLFDILEYGSQSEGKKKQLQRTLENLCVKLNPSMCGLNYTVPMTEVCYVTNESDVMCEASREALLKLHSMASGGSVLETETFKKVNVQPKMMSLTPNNMNVMADKLKENDNRKRSLGSNSHQKPHYDSTVIVQHIENTGSCSGQKGFEKFRNYPGAPPSGMSGSKRSCCPGSVKDINTQKQELIKKAVSVGLVENVQELLQSSHCLTERAQLALLEKQINGKIKSRILAEERRKCGLPDRISNCRLGVKQASSSKVTKQPAKVLASTSTLSENSEKVSSCQDCKKPLRTKTAHHINQIPTSKKFIAMSEKQDITTAKNEHFEMQKDDIGFVAEKDLSRPQSSTIIKLKPQTDEKPKALKLKCKTISQCSCKIEQAESETKPESGTPIITSFIARKEKLENWDMETESPSMSLESISRNRTRNKTSLVTWKLMFVSCIVVLSVFALYYLQPNFCDTTIANLQSLTIEDMNRFFRKYTTS